MVSATNTNLDMTLKGNSGESTGLSIVVNKAIALGANCIIGVVTDYGTTANNAATANMQGAAAVIRNLDEVLSDDMVKGFRDFETALARANEIPR